MHTSPAAAAALQEHGKASTVTDIELAERAARGDELAFESIMRRHNRMLFRTARSILKSDAESEDALQEAYLRAWRSLANFRGDSKLSTWLARIVINEALGRLRRKRKTEAPAQFASSNDLDAPEQELVPDEPETRPDGVAMRAQLRSLIEARIDMLPASFRCVFVLRAVEELDVKQVAQALDLPEATVRTRYFRARNLLRQSLSSAIDVSISDAFGFAGSRCDRIVATVMAALASMRAKPAFLSPRLTGEHDVVSAHD